MFATRFMLMALTCSALWLTGYSTMQAGQPAPISPTPPGDREAKAPDKEDNPHVAMMSAEEIEKMFPDGFVHDFGIMPSGTQATHAFRMVNTSDVPLRIVSVRLS